MCLVNAWNYDGIPWVVHECEEEAREIFKLRYKMLPRLRAAFDEYKATGKPPMRALVMDYTQDRETYKIDDQWLFCDDLLVAPIFPGTNDERDVYLPVDAKWVNYYTDEPVESGWTHIQTKDIPIFRRVD
jgi:alpha-D-xyloside xylohydrolase